MVVGHSVELMFFCLFILLVFVFWIPVGLIVRFHSHNGDDRLEIEGELLWGLVRYRLDVPVISWNLQQPLTVRSGMAVGEGILTKTKTGKLSQYIKTAKDVFDMMADYRYFIHELRRTAVCVDFRCTTEFGCSDPAVTGICTGLLWAIQQLMVQKLVRCVRCACQPCIAVCPSFDQSMLACTFHCIFHLRIGDIMIAGLKTLLRKGR